MVLASVPKPIVELYLAETKVQREDDALTNVVAIQQLRPLLVVQPWLR
jgi:hypothetical protein